PKHELQAEGYGLRSNDASHAKDRGKLGPKWEGPYEVTKLLGNEAYTLKDRNGNELPRTWNICNLKSVIYMKSLEDTHFPLVDLLKSKKDAEMEEVLDCFLLDGPLAELPEAASLQPCIQQLSIPIHHVGDKTVVGETSLSFALMNVHACAEGAKKHAAALRQLMMKIVSAPLSSQTWVGEGSISVAPFSVEDYTKEDTDDTEVKGEDIPQMQACHGSDGQGCNITDTSAVKADFSADSEETWSWRRTTSAGFASFPPQLRLQPAGSTSLSYSTTYTCKNNLALSFS
ncbi:hypothetical protein Tco_0875395, partial [Tanacetum coccineum]